jgi:hypothetical protein
MQTVLYIVTRKDDALAGEVVAHQREHEEIKVQTFDLTEDEPDYDRLLKEIFKADSIHVW